MRRRIVYIASGLALCALAAWIQRDALRLAWWDWSAGQPLTEAQARRISSCEAVGWTALKRAVAQDEGTRLAITECGPFWLPEQVAAIRSPLALAWLHTLAQSSPQGPGRLELALGLWLRTGEGGAELSQMLLDADGGTDVLDAVMGPGWTRPELRSTLLPALRDAAVARRFLEEPQELPEVGSEILERWAWWPVDDAGATQVAQVAMDFVEWDQAGLDAVQERRQRGASLGQVGPEWRQVLARGVRCDVPLTPPCALALADRLVPTAPREAPEPISFAEPLWQAIFSEDARAWHAASRLIRDRGAWVQEGPPDEQAARLALLLTPSAGAVDLDRSGDPAAALLGARVGPWTSVFALWLVAESASVEARIYMDGERPWLQVGCWAVGLNGASVSPAPAGIFSEISPTYGLAQVAHEGAEVRESTLAARRLRQLAALAEPTLFAPPELIEEGAGYAGGVAGRLLRSLRAEALMDGTGRPATRPSGSP